jgi:hypothetical protein
VRFNRAARRLRLRKDKLKDGKLKDDKLKDDKLNNKAWLGRPLRSPGVPASPFE